MFIFNRSNLALFCVSSTILLAGFSTAQAKDRNYWVVAETVQWDYAQTGINQMDPSMTMNPWAGPGATQVYTKARYIQYTDDTYTTQVPQPESRGILGPELRAEVGDKIIVHFKNNTNVERTMHPHGVRYTPENDGADHALNPDHVGAFVPPGGAFIYEWYADVDAGPGPNDPTSIMWAYHSHADSVRDIYAGLIGTIVVIKKGFAIENADGNGYLGVKGVDKEFTTMFMVFNEEDGVEGGLMHTMNGEVFGNNMGYNVTQGDKVRWYLLAMGTEVDLHTAHWHGQTVLSSGVRTDVVELMPTSMKTVDMTAKNQGDWLFHCHVTDHITAGMMTRWSVN